MTDDITVSRELLRQLQSLCMDVRKHSNLRMATLAIPLYDALRAALDATCQDSRQVQTAAEWVRCAAHGAQHDVREIIADMQTAPVQEPVAWSMTYNGDHCGNFYESRTDAEERMADMNAKHPLDERTIEPLYPAPPPAPDIDYDALKGTDMTDKITELKQLVIEAADRIEQLERENEANERNLCQLTDDLAASRRENAELRKELQAEHERQRRVVCW